MGTNLEIGKYVEQFVDWLSTVGRPFFEQVTLIIGNSVKSLQIALGAIPPFVMIAIITLLAFFAMTGIRGFKENVKHYKKSFGLPIFVIIGLLLIYAMGFWGQLIDTLVLVLVSTIIILIIGIPLGIICAKSPKTDAVVRPILDFMQTMPAFVYLIPAILFFSVGDVPGVLATVIFSLPPAVRMTTLGIQKVPEDIIEASLAFGCTNSQMLYKVQIPLAMPTILAGVNQTIMLALSMVVICSMVGAGGLGESVYASIQQADMALGFEAGLSIVILAIILDRITQAIGNTDKASQ
ncbi:glycine/betaine ABC transporter [Ignatzschineria ureiclastica]|uniref:Glycine/betaine ABC transporter n=1 Tax=Ignatzschineria ureiclastica TaxID=472582 RepID=A0A2U2ADM3_9GAMM|nr:proline/glycine betaine ABC transporter permease [Ignatzschineria ureiclastica]PWD80765.1 glycine/betaine ABC transporter [Ignatzschineria ureiclastica]GGZ94811.1 glycine/betaine ABC transporter permease [Ignatzschineria ureiclastica]